MTRDNATWLEDLRSSGERQEAALGDLRATIVRTLPLALSRWLPPGDPRLPALADEVAQETLVRALAKLDSFQGRSQFTTWVNAIAVHLALSELRRRRWRDASLEGLLEDAGQDGWEGGSQPGDPERRAIQQDLLRRLEVILQEELTGRQRMAMAALLKGMPMEEVAQRMGMKRNALYKLIYDARLRLKRRMAREGISPAEMIGAFEPG